MKKIITKRENGTLRVQLKTVGPSMTDQSDKNMVDINSIMANYAKTGLLPAFKEKVESYIDTTQIPSYIEAQAQIREAGELFEQLPAPVRKLMDNNPANLEKVISNPEYKDILLKYGVLEESKPVQVEDKSSPKQENQAKPDKSEA